MQKITLITFIIICISFCSSEQVFSQNKSNDSLFYTMICKKWKLVSFKENNRIFSEKKLPGKAVFVFERDGSYQTFKNDEKKIGTWTFSKETNTISLKEQYSNSILPLKLIKINNEILCLQMNSSSGLIVMNFIPLTP